ncbi:MAG: nitrilase-related carbon-nitrogen hydrolase, partial [Deltaproteobacteria bacterium]
MGTDKTSDKKTDSIRRTPEGPLVGVAQIAPVLGDIDANLAKYREAVETACSRNVDLLVLPELSLSGYRLKDMVPEIALGRDSHIVAELTSLSSRLSLVAGFVEESPEHHFYNVAAYFEGGRLVSIHRKVYLPTYGMFDEQRYFARGQGVRAFNTSHGRMAMLVCEDALHPSALTVAALDGATTVIVPSASPVKGVAGEGEVDANGRHWEAYNRAMARSLGIHLVYANRCGVEDGITFWGGSEILGPGGEQLAKAAYYDEDLITAVLSQSSVRQRRIQSPVLRDEDIDLTINELCRIRGRQRPDARSEARPDTRSESRGGDFRGRRDDDSRGGGGYRGKPGGDFRGRRDDDSRGGGGYRGKPGGD